MAVCEISSHSGNIPATGRLEYQHFTDHSNLSANELSTPFNPQAATMSQGDDFSSYTDVNTMRGRDFPSIKQFTVFLENRVGILMGVLRRFSGTRVRILALSIIDSTECCIVRFVLSHPEQGREILERAGLAMIESDLIALGVERRRTTFAGRLHLFAPFGSQSGSDLPADDSQFESQPGCADG